jgi:ATP synthase protein I
LNLAAQDVTDKARRLIFIQAVIGVIVAGGFLAAGGPQAAAALYGALISMALALLLGRRMQRASEVAASDPRRGMTILYVGAVQRFVLVLALLALGLAVLKLNPLPLLAGFAVTQLAYVLGARAPRRADNKKEARE